MSESGAGALHASLFPLIHPSPARTTKVVSPHSPISLPPSHSLDEINLANASAAAAQFVTIDQD